MEIVFMHDKVASSILAKSGLKYALNLQAQSHSIAWFGNTVTENMLIQS